MCIGTKQEYVSLLFLMFMYNSFVNKWKCEHSYKSCGLYCFHMYNSQTFQDLEIIIFMLYTFPDFPDLHRDPEVDLHPGTEGARKTGLRMGSGGNCHRK